MSTEINLEAMNKEYSRACVKAVQDTIHKLVLEWGDELLNTLKKDNFKIVTKPYNNAFCIEAYVGKDNDYDYYTPERYADNDLNTVIQLAFDELPMQVTLNAMICAGMELTDQPVYWELA